MLVKPDRSFHSRLLALRRLLAVRSIPLALSLLLVLALLASLAPMPAEAAASSPVTCVTYHTVREGDTRVTISQVYRVKWLKIAQANGLREPYKLTPGQLLCIPAKETNTTTALTATNRQDSNMFRATVNGNKIQLVVFKNSAKTSYLAKVRAGVTGGVWYKLGYFDIPANTAFASPFGLPFPLHDEKFVTICLKNQTTDETPCNTVAVK